MGVGVVIYLLDKATTTARWNGIPLHEAKKGELKEILNGDYVLSIDYPITDSEHYRLLDNDKIIITDTPDNGRQLFRIKHRTELDDTVNLTCSHITEDAFKRIVGKFGVERVGCNLALNSMINALKTPFSDFSFDSDISEPHTFNNADNSTVYKVLFDGEHSIINTWKGELIRDNYSIRIVQSRGRDNNVVITTHQNLKKYERTNDTASIITRIHVTSKFKNEGAKEDTVLHVTVDSPLINQYPYINEAEYNNNDLKTVAELEKWARAKFEHEKIDKMTDVIKIEAYELDGQKIQIGDTVTISSLLHDVSVTKKVTGYTYDVLAKEYIDFTFDEKGTGGSGGSTSSGVSGAADMILNSIFTDVEVEKKIANLLANADRAFDSRFQKMKESIEDSIEKSKALSEEEKARLAAEISSKLTASKIDTDKIKADFDKWLKEPLKELQDEIDKNAQLSKINNELIGGDGITRYNKNRLAGEPNRTIELGTDYIEVGHNGSGFEVGQQYTISWSAECTPYGHRDVTTLLRTPYLLTGGKVVYTPQDNRFPTIQHNFTTDRAVVPMVYFGLYNVRYESNWYKTKTIVKNINETQEDVTLQLEWKEIFDGNQDNAVLLGWSDTPDLIIDGGGA